LERLGLHEGDYTFRFIFNDETGRPIGSRLVSMILQSATAEARDVEISYKWEMMLLAWQIMNPMILLAMFNEAPRPDPQYEGSETYTPMCGDHSETFLGTHYYGEQGPMWYPYQSCQKPRYHEDDVNYVVKCKRPVEGFGPETPEGIRWSYWERMRGNDKFSTWNAGVIAILGCFYREWSYTYQLTGAQDFVGYTRIRSCHPNGAFAKDREALRVSRHFVKRNLKVREEAVTKEDDAFALEWTDEFAQIVFSNTQTFGTRIGSEQDTAIWVHIVDGISEVKRTYDNLEHPFGRYLLKSVGSYDFNETFITPTFTENRFKLSEVLEDRDLTSIAKRSTDGSLVYTPGEPYALNSSQSYDDIIPVYKIPGTAWGWLERPKDIIRGTPRISGLSLYNPSVALWKTDKESAVYTDEGTHDLVYTPPIFDINTGNVITHPTVSWAGGPAKVLSWYTGTWVDQQTAYDSSIYPEPVRPTFFGKTCSTSTTVGFLADSTGLQPFVNGITNAGLDIKYTMRGVGVSCSISQEELPYVISNAVNDVSPLLAQITKANTKFYLTAPNIINLFLEGLFYVEEIHITYKFGPETGGSGKRYDIPSINVYVTSETTSSWVASGNYQKSPNSGVVEGVSGDGTVYTQTGYMLKKVTYSVGTWAKYIYLVYGTLRADANAGIEEMEILYRKPVERTESVWNYEQKVNLSQGLTGEPDYRKMLYYYSRTLVDYGDGLEYNLLAADNGLKSTKFTNRSIKDVILEYEFFDPLGVRFPYGTRVHPQTSAIGYPDSDGVWTVPGALSVCTKGQTLVAGIHKNDSPPYITVGDRILPNNSNTALNETSDCTTGVGNKLLNEEAQECLFNEARSLLGGDPVSVFNWFWHPDEVAFWEGELGKVLPTTIQLELVSRIPKMYKLYQKEYFGCSSNNSVPYYDGRLHSIDKWQALGHRITVGNPQFNEACYDVVVNKHEEHFGESLYGTAAYAGNSGAPKWPYETYRDADYYREHGFIMSKEDYMGGRIGGAGIEGMVQRNSYAHGNLFAQRVIEDEVNEVVNVGRIKAAQADATHRGFHED